MTKEHVYESAAQTAKKIRQALKQAYPGVKFSVRSSTYSMGSSVDVYWTDGPFKDDVDRILNRFQSGSFDGMEDMYTSTGYEWEGKIVTGAKYICSSRTLSDEREIKILKKLQDLYESDTHGQYSGRRWIEAEMTLIECGELHGYIAKVPGIEVEVVPVTVTLAKVIPFPVKAVKDPELSAVLKAEKLMNALTPEQKLKLTMLQNMFGKEDVAMLLMQGTSADDIFQITANRIFGGSQG